MDRSPIKNLVYTFFHWCLVVDWNGFYGKFWLWKVGYVLIAAVALVTIFVVALLVMLCYTGLVIDITPVWATWGFVYFPVYVLLVAVIDWYISRKHKKKTEA